MNVEEIKDELGFFTMDISCADGYLIDIIESDEITVDEIDDELETVKDKLSDIIRDIEMLQRKI